MTEYHCDHCSNEVFYWCQAEDRCLILLEQEEARQENARLARQRSIADTFGIGGIVGVIALIGYQFLTGKADLVSRVQAAVSEPGQPTARVIVEGLPTNTPDTSYLAPFLEPNPTNSIAPFFPPSVQFWAHQMEDWAAQVGIDPNLAATVMTIESCGDPLALSRSGAMGLFQVMPFHFLAGEDPYDPDTNALRGLSYLAKSLSAANGDPRRALAGYNGGIGILGGSEANWSDQAKTYVQHGSPIYNDAVSGLTQSVAFDTWLAERGRSLCQQAERHLGISY